MHPGALPESPPYFYDWLSYPGPVEFRDRPVPTQAHRTRDKGTTCDLAQTFFEHGYAYGGTFASLPSPVLEKMPPDQVRQSMPRLKRGDVVLFPGRPPTHDMDGSNPTNRLKRVVWPSRHPFEQQMFEALCPAIIERSDSERLLLSSRVPLPEDARYYQQAFFKTVRAGNPMGALVRELRSASGGAFRPRTPPKTLAYLICVPAVPPSGFRLLLAFGMGGTESLVFSYLLRTCWKGQVEQALSCERPRVVVAEFEPPQHVPLPWLRYDPEELRARIVASVEVDGDTDRRVPRRARRDRSSSPRSRAS